MSELPSTVTPRAPRKRAGSAVLGAFIAVTLSSTVAIAAAGGDGLALVEKVKEALEPPKPSVRDITITIRPPDEEGIKVWTGRMVRKEIDGRPVTLTVLLAPISVEDFALLMRDEPGETDAQWMYVPPIGRVRKLVYTRKVQPFLDTDLTHADLGLLDTTHSSYRLAGTETIDGRKVTKVVEIPDDPAVFSKIEMWVDEKTHLPVRRGYFDRAGALWRVAHYAEPTMIDGVPTVMRIRVEDVQQGGETELELSNVHYDTDIPDRLFEPLGLADAPSDVFWASLEE